ncbi:hypothetical protein OPV22_026427 [Ensete ventricosum]|uniref:Uncharacterized protein n=1 Tax=Ensete ventricosum TaxID=4639 RepID=A0AAV8QLK7_ENSVE|nr:hypothetical protein OPV22_026427 [Ensete ventricosum]
MISMDEYSCLANRLMLNLAPDVLADRRGSKKFFCMKEKDGDGDMIQRWQMTEGGGTQTAAWCVYTIRIYYMALSQFGLGSEET